MSILKQIITDTRQSLVEKEKRNSRLKLEKLAREKAASHVAHRFQQALDTGNMEIIAEVKKASPSKGVISQHFYPLFYAKQYEQGGAAAISVLTEEKYFQGHLTYLDEISRYIGLPTLRKDFIVDDYQVYESVLHHASAILLIVAALDAKQLSHFIQLAASLNLDTLVEVHDAAELDIAINAGANIIGVNNRNLSTFETTLETSVSLSAQMPRNVTRVSESGIFTRQHMVMLSEAGFNAVLIGESLMRQPAKDAMLRQLLGREHVD